MSTLPAVMLRWRKGDAAAMTDRIRKRRYSSASSSSFWFVFFVLLCCALFFTVAFSTSRLFGASLRPALSATWQTPAMNAFSSEQPLPTETPLTPPPATQIQEAISFPDLLLLFIKPPSSIPNPDLLQCLYHSPSSSTPTLKLPPISSSTRSPFVRCPLAPQASSVSLSLSPSLSLPAVQPLSWDHLAYSAVLDRRDNTTVVFAKGFNLRSHRMSDPNRFECVFGWNFGNPKYELTSPAVSAAQEVFRCKTPLSILRRSSSTPPLVSIKTKGRGSITLPTIARPETLSVPRTTKKMHNMCVCTMVRNQARFLPEWLAYHARIGVERWFIYDNNSDDGIEGVVSSMRSVSLHEWPWVKTQEAGFSHCALRARDSCRWVGFIDVDEFLHLPGNATLQDVLRNYSSKPWVGELRTECHSFGPSGRKAIPSEGVTAGYTCRMAAPERHKAIVRPEALNASLINIVHHFHLRDGMRYVNMDSRTMVINHYKYQVWEVFKEKFYRRVATYVADWQDEENVGSKDRAPGLGTRAVEPPDWSRQFCEVNDTGLRDWVLRVFVDPTTGLLPW